MVAKKTPAKKTAAKKTAAKPAPTKLKVSASAKEAATKKGEPYVNVTSVELDPDNVENQAPEARIIQKRDLGDGRSEVS